MDSKFIVTICVADRLLWHVKTSAFAFLAELKDHLPLLKIRVLQGTPPQRCVVLPTGTISLHLKEQAVQDEHLILDKTIIRESVITRARLLL